MKSEKKMIKTGSDRAGVSHHLTQVLEAMVCDRRLPCLPLSFRPPWLYTEAALAQVDTVMFQ
jgi:hypothetical protein